MVTLLGTLEVLTIMTSFFQIEETILLLCYTLYLVYFVVYLYIVFIIHSLFVCIICILALYFMTSFHHLSSILYIKERFCNPTTGVFIANPFLNALQFIRSSCIQWLP